MNSNVDYNADFLTGESPESGAADVGGIITISKNGDNSLFVDEDSGLGMETVMIEASSLSPVARFLSFHDNLGGSYSEMMPSSPVCRRGTKRGVRRGLLSRKPLADSQEVDDLFSPSVKKMKELQLSPLVFKHDLSDAIGDMNSDVGGITLAVARCIQDDADQAECPNDVIKECPPDDVRLPTIPGKHSDLQSISPSTLAEIVRGGYGGLKRMQIVDCRYPYEFEGGHVKGAKNLYTTEAVAQLLADMDVHRPAILVFHCEFSSHRGPRMSRFLRNEDRELNKDRYPELNYPDMYLVDGGYKAIFEQYPDLCVPAAYKPMLNKDHAADLGHFRVNSKSRPQRKPDKKPLRLTKSRLVF